MTIIKIDMTNEDELTDAEYDAVNNAFMRKAKEMGIFDNYLEEDIHWTIECRNMNIKQYEELIMLYDSWWDSLPREMQIEIRKFYGETTEKDDGWEKEQ